MYAAVLGAAVGMLVTGVVVPFAVDDERGGAGSGPVVPTRSALADEGRTLSDAVGATANQDDGSGSTPSAVDEPSSVAGSGVGAAPSGVTGTPGSPLRVGFTIYGVGNAGRLGIPGLVDERIQRLGWQAFVDEVNATGGINGRRIEPIYSTFDVTSPDSARATCLFLTEDQQVFAVVGSLGFPGPRQCVTKEHATPLISSDIVSDAEFTASGGLLFTTHQAGLRMMANFAADLDQLGVLRGRKIGILSEDGWDPGAVVARQLEHELTRAGHRVVRRGHLSGDISTAGSQMPVEVNQMRSAGAEVVAMLTEMYVRGTSFVQTADAQGFRPQYVVSDWGTNFVDQGSANTPDSFDGTIGITSSRASLWVAGAPERPIEADCKRIYESRSGERLAPRGNDANYGVTMQECDLVRIFATAARAARAGDLTQASLTEALGTSGRMTLAWGADGSFRPDKHDLFDQVRTNRWSAACKCFRPVGDFRPTRY